MRPRSAPNGGPKRRQSIINDAGLEGVFGDGSNVRVAVRVRPLSSEELVVGHSPVVEVVSDKQVAISKAARPGAYLRSQQAARNEYGFDVAFGAQATQQQIYEQTAKPLIDKLLDGYNATVFAYGATGAGKTHTMLGSVDDPGIIHRALSDIFKTIEQRADASSTWKITVSYLEVYNETIRDLLNVSPATLELQEDASEVRVAGLCEMEVYSDKEVLALLQKGSKHRKMESTAANSVSSRSHAVFQVVVHKVSRGNGEHCQQRSKLSLIDLAGSERASATQNRGIRLHEGANINKSLLALANCINALSCATVAPKGSTAPRVKYRDSKLTHLLKNSLEGECLLVMIANINPSLLCYEESHNTLKYANRAKNIKVTPTLQVLSVELPENLKMSQLEEENMRLKARLDALSKGVSQSMSSLPTMNRWEDFEQERKLTAQTIYEEDNEDLSFSDMNDSMLISTGTDSMDIDSVNQGSVRLPGSSGKKRKRDTARGEQSATFERRVTRRSSTLLSQSSSKLSSVLEEKENKDSFGKGKESMLMTRIQMLEADKVGLEMRVNELKGDRLMMNNLIDNLQKEKAKLEDQLRAVQQENDSLKKHVGGSTQLQSVTASLPTVAGLSSSRTKREDGVMSSVRKLKSTTSNPEAFANLSSVMETPRSERITTSRLGSRVGSSISTASTTVKKVRPLADITNSHNISVNNSAVLSTTGLNKPCMSGSENNTSNVALTPCSASVLESLDGDRLSLSVSAHPRKRLSLIPRPKHGYNTRYGTSADVENMVM